MWWSYCASRAAILPSLSSSCCSCLGPCVCVVLCVGTRGKPSSVSRFHAPCSHAPAPPTEFRMACGPARSHPPSSSPKNFKDNKALHATGSCVEAHAMVPLACLLQSSFDDGLPRSRRFGRCDAEADERAELELCCHTRAGLWLCGVKCEDCRVGWVWFDRSIDGIEWID